MYLGKECIGGTKSEEGGGVDYFTFTKLAATVWLMKVDTQGEALPLHPESCV